MAQVTVGNSYQARRAWLEEYFDRTAAQTWARLTSDVPVGRIRATVRQGRDRMRSMLLSWLPQDLTGRSVLDAGCGTGAAAVELAARGASVVAIDLSPTLVDLAARRLPEELKSRVRFLSGDMLDEKLGSFDHVIAMDSVIHYEADDMVNVVRRLAERTTSSLVFTFAPRTSLLAAMHAVGSIFPRGTRAPRIEPIAEERLKKALSADPGMASWHFYQTERIQNGFYTSQAVELRRLS